MVRQKIDYAGKQGDSQSRRLIAHIVCGTQPVTFSGDEQAFFKAARHNPDTGQTEAETFAAQIEDDAVSITLPLWVFTYPGTVVCEFAFATQGTVIHTESFFILTEASVKEGLEIAEDNEIVLLDTLLAQAEGMMQAFEEYTLRVPEVDDSDNGKILQVVDGEWAAAELPVYDGQYEVTPLADAAVTLETQSTFLDQDIVVREVPYQAVSNAAGGETVSIAS